MAYVRMWVHLVFGTKNRYPFLPKEKRDVVISHILEYAREKDIYINRLNGFDDHLHCLISLMTEQSLAKVVNLLKGESSHWINANNITKIKFEWADEYYASSVSESQVEIVRKYIEHQEQHHRRKTYADECEEFIRRYGFQRQ